MEEVARTAGIIVTGLNNVWCNDGTKLECQLMLTVEGRWIETYESPGLDEIIARFGTVGVT